MQALSVTHWVGTVNRMDVFKPKKKSDKQQVAIRYLTISLFVAVGLVVHAHFLMSRMPENFTVHHPPNLATGGHVRVNETPRHVVYAFAFRFYQNVESCLDTCGQNRLRNIDRFRWYLSDRYYSERRTEALERQRQDMNITRTISEYSKFSGELVRDMGNNVWVVTLQVRIVDKIGGRVISDAVHEVPIRVVGQDIDRSLNPWMLGLDGTQGAARRIEVVPEDS